MGNRIFLSLFIVCAIVAHGIGTGTLLEDHLVRKKRLINRIPNENRPIHIEDVPFIVNIQEDGSYTCSGSILLANVILTTAFCVLEELEDTHYSVLSGSSFRQVGRHHNVVRIKRHPHYRFSYMSSDDLALLTIFPPIDLVHSVNRHISLINGTVPPNTLATTSGWGPTNVDRHGLQRMVPNELRSITLPTISVDECRREYNNDSDITNKVICTYDRFWQMHATIGDEGNPLVVRRQLIGIMAWSQGNGLPDVYMNLAYPEYKAWIVANLLRMSSYLP